MISRRRNCLARRGQQGRRVIASDVAAPAGRGGVERPSGLHRRRQPHAVHQGARQAGTVHAGRSRGAVRPAAAAAPAVRARRVRPGHPRLRQRDRRRDEPGARRGAAARHGRGDDGVHGADQLRLRHAVDRHRLSYIRRASPTSSWPAARKRSATRRWCSAAARSTGTRGSTARAISGRASWRCAGFRPVVPQAGHRARARPHRSRSSTSTWGRPPNWSRICFTSRAGRPMNTPPKASSGWRGRSAKDGSTTRSSRPSPATARSTTMTMACGPTARWRRWPSSSRRSSGPGAR